MKNLRVQNVKIKGSEISNQFEIFYSENNKHFKIFQSYGRMVIKWENGIIVEVGSDWDYSRTTGKYRNMLTRTNKKEFEKMLQNNFMFNEETQTYIRTLL